ncbi:MAG: diaminopimelate decarboxylase [Deltaproteobacteria bacterium]|nr:diaminopimelate decarboxylase [Deltaproteobacteria bacterium]
MHHFQYKGDELFCEDVPLRKITEQVGTPTYVYSLATLERHFGVFDQAFAKRRHLICFSVKASSNLAILRALFRLGAGADIVSGGELYRALRAGCDPKKIVFSGVGKRDDEIEHALESEILAFNVESVAELSAIDRVAAKVGVAAPVALRVNPDVDAETHPYISTGLKKNKFGISVADAREAYRLARRLPNIEVKGIDCHIGSQLTKTSPFRDAIRRVAALAHELRREGVPLAFVDVGGGLGIPYQEEGEEPPSPHEYGQAICDAVEPFDGLDLTLVCEPGRVIVGNAGVLLTKVLYLKQSEIKNFTIVDAALNDLIRPAFYQSYHSIKPALRREGVGKWVTDIVGPICETGDFLARDREIQKADAGDVLAVMSAGAYGFTMASNYNSRPRAAEVLVTGDTFSVIRRREDYEDLVRGEEIPAWL